MTAATPTGTPLIIPVLSIIVAILAVLVALVNAQRQLQVAAREAWMREFREHVSQILSAITTSHSVKAVGGEAAPPPVVTEMAGSVMASFQAINLLIAEKGTHAGFMQVLSRLLVDRLYEPDLSMHITEVGRAAADILRRERAAADPPWSRFVAWLVPQRLQHVQEGAGDRASVLAASRGPPRRDDPQRPDPPRSRFVAWLVRDPPRFPD
jgi:hypothetical protein